MENQSTYRVRTNLGDDKPINIPVNLMQEYNSFEILSLKVNMDDTYRSYTATEGIVVGRVSTANNGLGIPNVRVSIFVPKGQYDQSDEEAVMYPFSSPTDLDGDRVRYNLLPSDSDVACYQIIGTLPTKRKILDNETVLEVFDKFYKYTTVTNEAGDFMLSNIPVGKQRLHIDADLSDIGPFLSQKPYDMIENLGFDKNKFESTRQFKTSADLDSLVQVISQNKSVYVYPYWGDITENSTEMKITRTDLSLNYEFKTSAIFIGSVITDKQSNSIRQNCTPTENVGKMADMVTGPGKIEMIRKTVDDKIEQYRVKGDQLINDNGVWCYQVPMNLDYVRTDEFGNIIPTDDPKKGVPTRARVRFRITLNQMESDNDAHKRCSYLVPNNPKTDDEKFLQENDADYSFGSETWDESFVDLFWNKVYTVKNYIPQLQKTNRPTNRKHTGIKMVNHFGDNNPFPYNAMSIKLPFQFRLICVIVKIFINLISFINIMISIIGALPCEIAGIKIVGWRPFKSFLKFIPGCIALSPEFCDDGINKTKTYPSCDAVFDCIWMKKSGPECRNEQREIANNGGQDATCTTEVDDGEGSIYTCVENQLAQQNEATSFNFSNDWINGCLYMPLWYRHIKPKKSFFFGLFKRKAKDQWCSANGGVSDFTITRFCAHRNTGQIGIPDYKGVKHNYRYATGSDGCGDECHEIYSSTRLQKGIIIDRETMFGTKAWYYKSVEIDEPNNSGSATEYLNIKSQGKVSKTLFATDIVMLGSMNDCDLNGIPKFFNYLKGSTYNMPTDILFTDTERKYTTGDDGNTNQEKTTITVASGADWGNKNEYGLYHGGLFYGIGCSTIEVRGESCVNLKRICEIGVGLDEMNYIEDLTKPINSETDELDYDVLKNYLRPDGFVSYDDIIDFDYRSMFATMNGNQLRTKINTSTGVKEYDFRHLYIDNFDGSLKGFMMNTQSGLKDTVNYKNNYKLEEVNPDYFTFRMGDNPYYYDGISIVTDPKGNVGPQQYRLPKYRNSFYFYFGLKEGKTAIDLFNEEYNGVCIPKITEKETVQYEKEPNGWCHSDRDAIEIKDGKEVQTYNHANHDGYLKINLENIPIPFTGIFNSKSNGGVSYTILSDEDADGDIQIKNQQICFYGKLTDSKVVNGYNRCYLLYENVNADLKHGDKDGVLCYMLNNGEYTLNIIDGEGNQHSFDINLKGEYLTFQDVEEPFAQPNNVLLKYYNTVGGINRNSPYYSVSKAPYPSTQKITINTDESGIPNVIRIDNKGNKSNRVNGNETVKLNGTICLYNLMNDGNDLDSFIVEVDPYLNEDEDLKEWYHIKMIYVKGVYKCQSFTSNGDIILESDITNPVDTDFDIYPNSFNLNGVNVPCFIIKCPKGGVDYMVRITQICKKNGGYEKTQNFVERKIYVSEPTPYKLFINDVDYDIIQDFVTGWNLQQRKRLQTGDVISGLSPFTDVGSIGNIDGWLNISDINNPQYKWGEDSSKYGETSTEFMRYEKGDVIKFNRGSFIDIKNGDSVKINGDDVDVNYDTISIRVESHTTAQGQYVIDKCYLTINDKEEIDCGTTLDISIINNDGTVTAININDNETIKVTDGSVFFDTVLRVNDIVDIKYNYNKNVQIKVKSECQISNGQEIGGKIITNNDIIDITDENGVDRKYVINTNGDVIEEYVVKDEDEYIGQYIDEVELNLLKDEEPIEPKRFQYDNESLYKEDYERWAIKHDSWEKEYNKKKETAQIVINRMNFVKKMKSSFWIQSETKDKNINYSVQTDDTPYDVWTLYNAEAVSTSNEEYNETESKANDNSRNKWIYTSESTFLIKGIKIPNITSYNSKMFGVSEDSIRKQQTNTYGTIKKERVRDVSSKKDHYVVTVVQGKEGGICFGQDNVAENSTESGSISIKPPYIVACVNNEGKTKPDNLIEKNFYDRSEENKFGFSTYKFGENGSNKGWINDGTHKFFQFYLIDKIFAPDIVCWSKINNIPYYRPWYKYDDDVNDETRLGYVVKCDGILSGNINNGITSSRTKLITDFKDSSIFGLETPVITYTEDDEDSIPTRRCIWYGDARSETNETGDDIVWYSYENDEKVKQIERLKYINYRHTDKVSQKYGTNQYRNVPAQTSELNFVDAEGQCETNRTLYGSLKFRLDNGNDRTEDGGTFWEKLFNRILNEKNQITSTVKTDNDRPITYYIFKVSTKKNVDKVTDNYVWYPLNAFKVKTTTDGNDDDVKREFWIDCKNDMDVWDGTGTESDIILDKDGNPKLDANGKEQYTTGKAAQIFNKNTLEIVFKDKDNLGKNNNGLSPRTLISKVNRTNEEGETVSDTTYGYGNDGTFKNLEDKSYFMVAVTENNCRAISPVYDFHKVYYVMGIVNSGGTNFLRVALVYVLRNKNAVEGDEEKNWYVKSDNVSDIKYNRYPRNYYLSQFNFNISYKISIGENAIELPDTEIEKKDLLKIFGTGNFKDNEEDFKKNAEIGESWVEEESDGKWNVYTKNGGDIAITTTEVSTGTPSAEDANFYYQTRIDNQDMYVQVIVTTDGQITKSEATKEKPSGLTEISSGNAVTFTYEKKETITEKDPNTGEETTKIVTKLYKIEISYDNITEETVDFDPTIPHFMRYVDTTLSNDQYKSIKYLFQKIPTTGYKRAEDAITCVVTDIVGLQHICKLHTIVPEGDGKEWKKFVKRV